MVPAPPATTTTTRKCAVCGKPDAKPCARCHAVAYCGRAHQLQHWRAPGGGGHKRDCWPLKRVGSSDDTSSGFPAEHLVLTKPAQPGDVILEERPLALWPNHRAPPRRTRGGAVTVYDETDEEEDEEGMMEEPEGGGMYTSCMLCLRRIESGGHGTAECSQCSLETCGRDCPFARQEDTHAMFECDLLSFNRAYGPAPAARKTPEALAAAATKWEKQRRRQQQGILPPPDDPDAFLPFLGVLRCLTLKRHDPRGYAALLAMPSYAAYLDRRWLHTMLDMVRRGLTQRGKLRFIEQPHLIPTTPDVNNGRRPAPIPLDPHPDDGGYTASEVAHVVALTVFRTFPLPTREDISRPGRPLLEGEGIYPRAQWLRHSCRPNAVVSIQPAAEGFLLRVRALKELRAGEPVSIAYTSLEAPTRARWRRLRARHFPGMAAACPCARCQDPGETGLETSTLACPGCRVDATDLDDVGPLRPVLPSQQPQQQPAAAAASASTPPAAAAPTGAGTPDDSHTHVDGGKRTGGMVIDRYQCGVCGLVVPAAEVDRIETHVRKELQRRCPWSRFKRLFALGWAANAMAAGFVQEAVDLETMIRFYARRVLHPDHHLLLDARLRALEAFACLGRQARRSLEGPAAGENPRLRAKTVLQYDLWDEKLLSVGSRLLRALGHSRQTLLESDTALIVAEIALAEARRVERTDADVAGAEEEPVAVRGKGVRQIMGASPLKEASRRHAEGLLMDAQRALEGGGGGGPRYHRQLVLERWVLARVGGKDPAEEALAAGVFDGGGGEEGAVDEGVLRQLESMQQQLLLSGGFWGDGGGGAGGGAE